jgi:threonylcarbamoyladenosine tRNA methylthiotransferase MtaB
MKRHYTFNEFLKLKNYIIKKSPYASVSTDYIVGFPSETDSNHAKSLTNLKKLNLANIHLFPFSLKNGTEAQKIKNIVSDKKKKERFVEISKLNDVCTNKYLKKFLNKCVEVIFEDTKNEDYSEGHSQYFFKVKILNKHVNKNEMKHVKIYKIIDKEVFGKIV